MKKPPVHSINILNELEAEYPRFFFPLTLIVPGYELSRDSIVNIESVFMAFAEILLNTVYEQAAQAA